MRRAAFHAGILGTYAVLALLLTYPVAIRPHSAIAIAHQIPGWRPGDGDPWQALWAMWMVAESLFTTGRVRLSTDLVFYPLGVDIWYVSSVLPAALPMLLVIRWAGVVLAYNLLIVGSLASAAYATFLLVRRITRHTGAAFAGGLVFAFSPYQMAHAVEHVFLMVSGVLVPVYVLWLFRALDRGGGWNIVGAALVFTVTTIANFYYAAFLALFTLLLFAARLGGADTRDARLRSVRRSAGLLMAGVALLGPYLAFVASRAARDIEPRPSFAETNQWSADILAFFVPSPTHPWWGGWTAPLYGHFTGTYFEQTVYLGWVSIVLAGLALAWRHEARFWLLAGIAFGTLALGPLLHVAGRWTFDVGDVPITVPLPAILLYFVPGLSALKVMSRSAAIVMLAVAVLAGLGVAALDDRLPRRRPRRAMVSLVAIVSGLAILVDYLSVPLPVQSTRLPRVLQAMGAETGPRRSLLDVPLDWRVAKYEYYQTAHRKPLLVGLLPRPTPAVYLQHDGIPFMSLFQEPTRPEAWRTEQWDRRAALRLIDLFNLDTIVIHGEYLDRSTVERVRAVVMEYFPVDRVVEDNDLTAIRLRRDHDPMTAWTADAYDFAFAPGRPRFFIGKGWWPPEPATPTGFAWSMGRESTLAFYLPRTSPMTMDLDMSAPPVPGLPPQGVRIVFNEQDLGRIELDRQWSWRSYSIRVPAAAARPGLNVVRFLYDHTVVPRDVIANSRDARKIGVAFRRILLRDESRTDREPPPGFARHRPGIS
jgi:hypothetical protein